MTQYQQALSGQISPQMIEASAFEGITAEELRNRIARGEAVIPANKNHIFPCRAIGSGLKTKVNANIGSSGLSSSLQEELSKLHCALQSGADAIMDLSTGGNLCEIRRAILKESSVMAGTVPLYAVMANMAAENMPFRKMTSAIILEEIEKQARQGVDFMTLHSGITRRSLSYLQESPRLAGVVSRGGSFLRKWMENTGEENPFFSSFPQILEICRKYDVTVSLGDGFRPGAGQDAGDRAQIGELLELGELVLRCREAGVQVMVEGPGHVPLDQVEMQVKLMKQLCHRAPVYVLGPLTTDIAPGYDHITAAIGGALAASMGADFLCYVTPAEHLCLPGIDDVKQGVMASRIAAHSADIAKGISGSSAIDKKLSEHRKQLEWEEMFRLSLDPGEARKRRNHSLEGTETPDSCTMCGALCSMKE